MIAKNQIFREYDIRGTVGEDFDAEFAYQLGIAYGEQVKEDLGPTRTGGDKHCLAVGHDCRITSPELSKRLREGLMNAGIDVIDSGMGPSPQLYFTVFEKDLSGGIQITGSHNPGDQNGFKMMIGKSTLSGSDISRLKERILSPLATKNDASKGKCSEFDARTAYIEELVERSQAFVNKDAKLKVVVDAGNGVGGLVGPEVLRQLGCEVIELYTKPDGSFPNHHPDPTVLENIKELRERVLSEGAQVGIAWDGDADRIGVVDEKANVVFGDMLLLVYARQLIKEVDSPTVIADVKCSELLFSELEKAGAKPVMWKTGHSLIKNKLKELNAELAGEMSGHMFFAHRFYGFDDAIHAAARLVEILSTSKQTLGELLSDVPNTVSTPELRVDCPEELKFKIAELAKDLFPEYETNPIDGVRITFPNGWGLVRASNTQPILVMRFEADSEQHLSEYQTLVETRIAELREKLA